MDDVEYEQPQDDLDIEITDIGKSGKPGIPNNSDSHGDNIPVTAKPAHSLLASRFLPRQRRIQLLITAGFIVLTLLVILASTPAVRDLARGAIFGPTPTPTPTLAPGANLFYISGTPPWGHVFIDGHPLSRLPVIGADPPLDLSRGTHLLRWSANPFKLQSCTVSVPARIATDTCAYHEVTQLKSGLIAWIITFSVSLDTLPDNQRTALVDTAQAALDAQQFSETVRPGELYADSSQYPCKMLGSTQLCFDTAKQALKATLHFQLDTNPASNVQCTNIGLADECSFQGVDCRLFCSDPTAPSPSSSSAQAGWNVSAVVRLLWDYTTEDGHIIAHDQPDTFVEDFESEHFVPLQITWDSAGWHATVLKEQFLNNPICTSAWDETNLGGFLGDPSPISTSSDIQFQWQFASGPVPAAGCVVVVSPAQTPGITPTPSPRLVAYLLQRFGVLLAANDLAHHYWPYLPVADDYEQQLAKQLVTQAGTPIN